MNKAVIVGKVKRITAQAQYGISAFPSASVENNMYHHHRLSLFTCTVSPNTPVQRDVGIVLYDII